MKSSFPKTAEYLESLDLNGADKLDIMAKQLIESEDVYERPSQALRRRFSRGAEIVEGMDRNGRVTKIKRETYGGKYKYFIEGADGKWAEPEERIWVVAMYALWQASKKKEGKL